MRKKKGKKYEIDLGVFVLFLTAIVVFCNVFKSYTLTSNGISLSLSIFVYPVVYFITNIITKKYGYKASLFAIIVSTVVMVLFLIIGYALAGREVKYFIYISQGAGYLVSQLINLTIYYYLLINTKLKISMIFINYVFALLVNNMIVMMFDMGMIFETNFWLVYFDSILIEAIIALMYSFFDDQIKRGI